MAGRRSRFRERFKRRRYTKYGRRGRRIGRSYGRSSFNKPKGRFTRRSSALAGGVGRPTGIVKIKTADCVRSTLGQCSHGDYVGLGDFKTLIFVLRDAWERYFRMQMMANQTGQKTPNAPGISNRFAPDYDSMDPDRFWLVCQEKACYRFINRTNTKCHLEVTTYKHRKSQVYDDAVGSDAPTRAGALSIKFNCDGHMISSFDTTANADFTNNPANLSTVITQGAALLAGQPQFFGVGMIWSPQMVGDGEHPPNLPDPFGVATTYNKGSGQNVGAPVTLFDSSGLPYQYSGTDAKAGQKDFFNAIPLRSYAAYDRMLSLLPNPTAWTIVAMQNNFVGAANAPGNFEIASTTGPNGMAITPDWITDPAGGQTFHTHVLGVQNNASASTNYNVDYALHPDHHDYRCRILKRIFKMQHRNAVLDVGGALSMCIKGKPFKLNPVRHKMFDQKQIFSNALGSTNQIGNYLCPTSTEVPIPNPGAGANGLQQIWGPEGPTRTVWLSVRTIGQQANLDLANVSGGTGPCINYAPTTVAMELIYTCKYRIVYRKFADMRKKLTSTIDFANDTDPTHYNLWFATSAPVATAPVEI